MPCILQIIIERYKLLPQQLRKKKLPILQYDPRKMYTEDFVTATKGKTVLIVGHSNTTPVFANKILGKEQYKNMMIMTMQASILLLWLEQKEQVGSKYWNKITFLQPTACAD